jgi:tripartite-type tricarboxylate transporter receptor subunit TctC
VQVLFGNIALALPMVKDGKVRALAVTSTTRATAAPDLPTVSESGLPGFESLSWFGVLAPAGTPPAIMQRLEAELQKAMATPAIKDRVATMGATPGVHHAAGFTRVIESETKRWALSPGAVAAGAATPATTAQRP